MEYSIEAIIFYLLLIDSIGANLLSWGGGRGWYQKNFNVFSRYFPATKGWTTFYLILVLFIGTLVF
ncbi:MAG: hypothetical protein ACE5F2_00355 [Candidatus Paceibacteria bacterium]